MTGYVVLFEGDDETGCSAYCPELPGLIAAGATRDETESLMRAAMVDHLDLLRATGEPVPDPCVATGVALLGPAAAGRRAVSGTG